MKWVYRILGVILVSSIVSSLGFSFPKDFFTTAFGILWILFYTSLSQIFLFSFSGITNKDFISQHKNQLSKLQKIFAIIIAFTTILFFVSNIKILVINISFIKLSTNAFIGCLYLFFLMYYIVNIIGLSNLKMEIEDLIKKKK